MEELRCRAMMFTNITDKTVSYWFTSLRKICSLAFQKRKKLGSNNTVIEIDECLLRGKRKNNRGRYLQMDEWNNAPNETYIPSSSDDETSGGDDSCTERYRNRIEGPWVVGICECSVNSEGKRKLLEARYFVVERRDKFTLVPLILQEVNHGATIFTDEWKGYRTLRYYGYNHITINHSKEYVTSEGHHTNTVEVTWHHLKTKLLRRMSGVPLHLLDSYLHEASIRSKYKDHWKFFNFILTSISETYT